MAEKPRIGGHDYHFVEEPPDALVCPVCLLPCREPHLISCCGKKVCHSCISRVQQVSQPCPLCRTPEFATMIDREVERQVLSLKVYCNSKQHGCTWIGELRQLERHLIGCSYTNVSCKYECDFHCPRQQMFVHERDECELRPEIVLKKTIDELTKRVAELEGTCTEQSHVIKRQQTIIEAHEEELRSITGNNRRTNEHLRELEEEREELIGYNDHLQTELGKYLHRVASIRAQMTTLEDDMNEIIQDGEQSEKQQQLEVTSLAQSHLVDQKGQNEASGHFKLKYTPMLISSLKNRRQERRHRREEAKLKQSLKTAQQEEPMGTDDAPHWKRRSESERRRKERDDEGSIQSTQSLNCKSIKAHQEEREVPLAENEEDPVEERTSRTYRHHRSLIRGREHGKKK